MAVEAERRPGQLGAQQRPRLAAEDRPLQLEQQRRGERRRAHEHLLLRAAPPGSSRRAGRRTPRDRGGAVTPAILPRAPRARRPGPARAPPRAPRRGAPAARARRPSPMTPTPQTRPRARRAPAEISMPWIGAQAAAHGGLVDALGHADGEQRGRSCSPSGARRSSPSTASASRSASWARRWRSQRVGSHSSCTRRSASCSAKTRLIGAVWWYARPAAPPSVQCASRPTRSKYHERPGRTRRSSLRSARSPAVSGREAGRRSSGTAWLTANAASTRASSIAQRLAAQRRHAVDEQQRVVLAAGVAEPVERLRDAGRASRRGRRRARCSRRPSPRRAARGIARAPLAPRRGRPRRRRAPARRPSARRAGPRRRRRRGRRGRRSSRRRLHPGAAGAGERQRGAAVACANVSRRRTCGLVHDRGEGRVHGARRHARTGVRARSRAGGWDPRRAAAARGAAGHGASTSGKCSARWARSASRTKRRSSCVATR